MSASKVHRSFEIARRTLFTFGAAVVAVPASQGGVLAECAAWLALDAQIDQQSRRWSELETLLIRTARDGPTTGQVGSLPVRMQMDAIEAELGRLDEVREQALADLARLKPASIHDMAGQLAVAARIVRHEGGEVAPLVRNAWGFMATSCCPGCGAAYAPAGLRQG